MKSPGLEDRLRLTLTAGLVLALAFSAAAAQRQHGPAVPDAARPAVYRPALAVSEALEPYLKHVEPGHDAFPEEAIAVDLGRRLEELGDALRRRERDLPPILGAGFRGGRLVPADLPPIQPDAAFQVRRGKNTPQTPALDGGAFVTEIPRLAEDMRRVRVTEFLITALDREGDEVRTSVRFDIVGEGTSAWRVERVGTWRMTWRREGDEWRIAAWTVAEYTESRAKAPVFTETTDAALGSNESFRQQLSRPLDDWMASLDSVLTRDSNGHHGVAIGDADGDGFDDLYVAQPSGLPNRLYRARGDGTFEDATERAGVGVLDDTAQPLFADVDNDGDQDLVLATGLQPLLFANDGQGRFARVPDAFTFARPLQGVLTSIAMADYDRDGFLDLYLCVYSYFFGAGEEKAGTPAPYYDARNGPPGVLFRNDGRGRFVDATSEAGLDEGNDRYHFAAAWADYDGDGWIDLLVANDFGTKNLYRNLGRVGGAVKFEDVAKKAGVLDHGAGMSAAFVDYDNDGLLDIYTGNMWSDNGLRVTGHPAFLTDAPEEVRALYRRHARGNALFRNLGDGRFEDVTLAAGVQMGRWAWSSDAIDFDSDGWDDRYVVNGMLTREPRAGRNVGGGADRPTRDLDGFFWRQVVARSPLTRAKGTPYDEAWRAINELLIHGSIASRQRNVFFRNDGRGRFDEVSGAIGLDFDQDGRAFAAADLDRDGDPDLVLMAARQAPHLRIFRNDFARAGSSLAVRLIGTKSNRDAVGARVTVETERAGRRTKTVHAGSGFLSPGSRELIFGLGAAGRVASMTVHWPSGETQVFTDVPADGRLRIVEGGTIEREAFAAAAPSTVPTPGGIGPADASVETWMYDPFPAPDFSVSDAGGVTRSLSAFKGRPALLLFWSPEVKPSLEALAALGRAADALTRAGVAVLAVSVGPASSMPPQAGSIPVVVSEDVARSYAILNRHLFMNRQDLEIPTAFLVDGAGRIAKAYRRRIDAAQVVRDAGSVEADGHERLARAVPFDGAFYAPPPQRNYLPYGRELLDQGLEEAAVVAFERAAQAAPSAATLYRLGALLARTGDSERARTAFERALAVQPDLAEAHNDLGALLAQGGDLEGAIGRFKAALAAMPDYPDALNNLGYALLLTGQPEEARALYEKALGLQPDFPEALNNLGLIYGRAGDLARAERYFRDALARRSAYGEAANNLALVLVARKESAEAVRLLEDFVARDPAFEEAYVTLAKVHLSEGRVPEGLAVLERLLQRNATHPVALELVNQFKRQ
jgi:Flp pilus assembly protein TadD